MAYLTDTNILLRRQQPEHPHSQVAVNGVIRLRRQGEALHVARQNLIEFRNTVSRPSDKNGLGLTPSVADNELSALEREFSILPESDNIYIVWRELIAAKSVSGKQVHDARLVAAMLTYGITHLLTFNIQDFLRYQRLPVEMGAGIVVVHPGDV